MAKTILDYVFSVLTCMCNIKLFYQNHTKMYNRTYLANKATQKNMYNTKISINHKFWKRICQANGSVVLQNIFFCFIIILASMWIVSLYFVHGFETDTLLHPQISLSDFTIVHQQLTVFVSRKTTNLSNCVSGFLFCIPFPLMPWFVSSALLLFHWHLL